MAKAKVKPKPKRQADPTWDYEGIDEDVDDAWIEMMQEYLGNKSTEEREKGGPGSGHYGHSGRPGSVGGSVSRSVAMSVRTGRTARARQMERGVIGRNIANGKFTPRPISNEYNPGVTPSVIVDIEADGKAIAKAMDTSIHTDSVESEAFVYDISRELGWEGIVPYTDTTILDNALELHNDYRSYKIDEGEKLSVQLWVENADILYNMSNENGDERDLGRIFLLDVITGNPDRHAANVVGDADGNFYAIDNNRAFYESYGGTSFDSVLSDHRYNWNNYMDNVYSKLGTNIPDEKRKFGVNKSDIDDVVSLTHSEAFQQQVVNLYGSDSLVHMLERVQGLQEYWDRGVFREI